MAARPFAMPPEEADLGASLGSIRDEAFRCKNITTGLLDFSRLRAGQRVPVDVAEIIKAVARLVTHQQRGDNIQIDVEAAAGLPRVAAYVSQLQQAVVALPPNSIAPMPEGGSRPFRANCSVPPVR